MPTVSYKFAATVVLTLVTLHAALARPSPDGGEAFDFQDAGRVRRFTLAMDRYARRKPGGDYEIRSIRKRTSLKELNAFTRAVQRARGQRSRLVLYPAGRPQTLANRRLVTERVAVKTRDPAPAQALAKTHGATYAGAASYAPGFHFFQTPDSESALRLAEHLQALPSVTMAYPLLARQQAKRFTPNDTLFMFQWHLRNTGQSGGTVGIDANLTNVWESYTGSGIRIGIIDDGLETGHPDLSANVDTSIDWDYNDNDNDPSPTSADDHGTACAGVAAAVGDNSLGVCGAAFDATLVGLRLIAGPSADDEEADSVLHRNDRIYIKSNSWGPTDDGYRLEAPGPLTLAAFSNSCMNGRAGKGTIHFWAGGNGREAYDNSNYDGYANLIYTIAIAAIGNDEEQSYYSEPGANIVNCAPSSGGTLDITTTDLTGTNGASPNDYDSTFGGTSSATPLAAGVGALVLQANTNLGWRDVQEIFIRSARKVDASDSDWVDNGAGFHFNHKYGAGMVNADAAVQTALTWTNLGPQKRMARVSTVRRAVPDNNATGVDYTFSFSNTGFRVEHAQVFVDIQHTYRGDLQIGLTSPDGTESVLSEPHNDFNTNYNAWTLMSVRHWGEHADGEWTVNISDGASADTGAVNTIQLILHGTATNTLPGEPGLIGIPESVDNAVLSWDLKGPTEWFGQRLVSFDGHDAAQSGGLQDAQTNALETEVTGPGQLSFRWRASTEFNWDYFRFYIDGAKQAELTGNTAWESYTTPIASGSHLLRWAFEKDYSVKDGADAGWLDRVVYDDDLDNDGISDPWEIAYTGGTNAMNATSDTDEDGALDIEEYLAGTTPDSGASTFELTEFDGSLEGGLILRWRSRSGRRYRVERASTPTGGYTALATNIAATPPLNTWTDTTATGHANLYRIRLLDPME